ncbi:MAG: S8 family serine peptidase [Methylocella sp.]
MNPLELAGLIALMGRTRGRPEVVVGLVDGPIAMNHPDLAGDTIREFPGKMSGTCTKTNSAACMHGTFVAGILCAKRGSAAPALCPNCTLLAYSIFAETASGDTEMPSATPEDLTAAILACIEAGARILNLSLALTRSSSKGERALGEALDRAARRGVLIVAAAGNQGTVGSTVITGHPWVIPVAACDLRGKPVNETNLGHSIGRRGLRAPGDQITSLGAQGQPLTLGGTSVAAPFVTGAIALAWSEFPAATAAQLRFAFMHARAGGRITVTPPLLDAWAAYQVLSTTHSRR